ncbi:MULTISPECIES: response regulator transcription factor [unclassified Paenibacillus]|uniref:response regulator transcription factor n=1 Tax=unclassified Paenibacillus TaxID=185978 RepID=UPI00364087CE
MQWKVVTVDDELLVRNHLRSLIRWEQHGFVLCGEAGDGTEAKRIIEEQRPHLVIVDMNMPGIDGVELIEHISIHHASTKVIALSSYDSFDYVRGSLRFGAIDYLLKHRLNAEALTAVLDKVRSVLEADARHMQQRVKENEKWETASPALAQNYMRELLLGISPDLRTIQEHFYEMVFGPGPGNQRFVLLMMQCFNYELISARMTEQELTLFIRSITGFCRQIIEESGSGCTVYMERGKFAILLSLENERSEHTLQQYAGGRISRLEKSMELYFNLSVAFVQSPVLHDISLLSHTYQSLLRKLEGWNGDAPSQDDTGPAVPYVSIRQEKELLAAMESLHSGDAVNVVREVFAGLPAGQHQVMLAEERAVTELLQTAAKIAKKAGAAADWVFLEMAALQKQPVHAGRALEAVSGVYNRLAEELRKVKAGAGHSRYVGQALELIQLHYKAGLTLEETAERLGITAAYLSRLFKEEMSCTFTEYMTEYRIERSKQLIRDGTCTVKEIYSRVGFNSYSYFIKVFKDATGETPYNYVKRTRT